MGKKEGKREDWKRELISHAFEARKKAYIPYSGYAVGAAILAESGKIYSGCNVENASYGATNCAERTAVFKAVSEGEQVFKAIAIIGGRISMRPSDYAYPCGVCRQVMQEFCKADFLVIVAKSEEDFREYIFSELLPYGFGGDKLT